MGFFDKIDNVSGNNVIKKVLHWRRSKMSVTEMSTTTSYGIDCDRAYSLIGHVYRTVDWVNAVCIEVVDDDQTDQSFSLHADGLIVALRAPSVRSVTLNLANFSEVAK